MVERLSTNRIVLSELSNTCRASERPANPAPMITTSYLFDFGMLSSRSDRLQILFDIFFADSPSIDLYNALRSIKQQAVRNPPSVELAEHIFVAYNHGIIDRVLGHKRLHDCCAILIECDADYRRLGPG